MARKNVGKYYKLELHGEYEPEGCYEAVGSEYSY